MPELEISKGMPHQLAVAAVWATMLCPHDADARHRLALQFVKMAADSDLEELDRLREPAAEKPHTSLDAEWLLRVELNAGRLNRTIGKLAGSTALDPMIKSGLVASKILTDMFSIAASGSPIERNEIFDQFQPQDAEGRPGSIPKLPGYGRSTIRDIWSKYGAAAHFWAARKTVLLEDDALDPLTWFLDLGQARSDLPVFLAVSEIWRGRYEQLTYGVSKKGSRVTSSMDLWRVPAALLPGLPALSLESPQ